MPWNGSGVYTPPAASFPEVNGTVIDAGRYNPTLNDVAAGITNCLAKDGQNTPTANIPMGGFKFTGAANAAGAGELVTYDKAKSGTYTPTATNDSNLSGLTLYIAHWIRVGEVVTVSGAFEADAIATGATTFELSLPVASNFAATTNAAGGAWCDAAERSFRVSAQVANDRAYFQATLQNTTIQSFGYSFSYQVL